jgi:hypothetical protein
MKDDIIVYKTYDENLALNGLQFKITSKDKKARPVMLYYDIDQDKWSGTIFEQNKSWSPLNDNVVTKLVKSYSLNYEVREILRYKKWIERQYEEVIATRLFAEACQ